MRRQLRSGVNGKSRPVTSVPSVVKFLKGQAWEIGIDIGSHLAAKNAVFCNLSRNILDTKGSDTGFDQYLQGFHVLKKVVIMTCTKSAPCAIIEIKLKIMKDDPKDSPAELRRKTQKEYQSLSLRHSACSAGQKNAASYITRTAKPTRRPVLTFND
jgi:hypothetical protein